MHSRTALLAPLTELDDDVLVERFQHHNDLAALDTLLERYRRFARLKARAYFLVGADTDDIIQEGMIGLYKAARDFQPERQVSFRAFAELCITRQVITAVKAATRQKHQPLNRYVSLSPVGSGDDEGERNVEALLDDHNVADPADHVVSREGVDRLRQTMAEVLSGLEVDVLRLYVEGNSYQEIGEQLGRHTKSIDNALQRIKRKLDGHLNDDEAAAAVSA
ncbi:MAG TPA: RNA polymerase sporulation sigma factor SigH [Acidimicrobiales bacterium]|nr:RNA polymerase sporulation sigma factor SigH [Acidimicrobiales bacterium]